MHKTTVLKKIMVEAALFQRMDASNVRFTSFCISLSLSLSYNSANFVVICIIRILVNVQMYKLI